VLAQVPANSHGILHSYYGIDKEPIVPGQLNWKLPISSVYNLVTVNDTDYKRELTCKTGDYGYVTFPVMAVDNAIVGNFADIYVTYVMPKDPRERRTDDFQPEEKLIFKHMPQILNKFCQTMTTTQARVTSISAKKKARDLSGPAPLRRLSSSRPGTASWRSFGKSCSRASQPASASMPFG